MKEQKYFQPLIPNITTIAVEKEGVSLFLLYHKEIKAIADINADKIKDWAYSLEMNMSCLE